MTVQQNLDALMLEFDITQEAIARLAHVAPSTVTGWMQGSMPRPAARKALCEALGIEEDDLLSDKYGMAAKRKVKFGTKGSAPDFTDVPLYGAIAAGTPIEMITVEDNFPIPTKVHEKHPDAFLLRVVGESMNKILPNGCYALVAPCEDVEANGQPYAVCVNGNDATIKRVDKLANGFRLKPDSNDPTYAEQTYNYNEPGTEEITVIGRVVYHVMPFDWTY